jgi:hypothetical protein
MVLNYLFKFKHFSCCKFFQIQKYAKVIQMHIQKYLKFTFEILSEKSEKCTFSPGYSYQPGLKMCLGANRAAYQNLLSPGWCHQPGLKNL